MESRELPPVNYGRPLTPYERIAVCTWAAAMEPHGVAEVEELEGCAAGYKPERAPVLGVRLADPRWSGMAFYVTAPEEAEDGVWTVDEVSNHEAGTPERVGAFESLGEALAYIGPQLPANRRASVPLMPELLTAPETRQAARDIVRGFLESLPENMKLYSVLTALASTFVGLCDDHDIDAVPAFQQITATLFRNPETFGGRRSISPEWAHLYM